MIDSFAADLKDSGVGANSILPSIIDTPANRSAMPGAYFEAWTKPENIARTILLLASDHAKVVHGAAIPGLQEQLKSSPCPCCRSGLPVRTGANDARRGL